jgi:hypothetical protein
MMVKPHPFLFVRIFDPRVAGVTAPFQKMVQLVLREIVLIRAGVAFGNAQMPQKLDQNNVIAFFVLVCGYTSFIWESGFDRLSVKLLDFLFVVADMGKQLRSENHRDDKDQERFHGEGGNYSPAAAKINADVDLAK